MKYKSELIKSMNYLGKKKDTIFIGQATEYAGTAMTGTLSQINKKKIYKYKHF